MLIFNKMLFEYLKTFIINSGPRPTNTDFFQILVDFLIAIWNMFIDHASPIITTIWGFIVTVFHHVMRKIIVYTRNSFAGFFTILDHSDKKPIRMMRRSIDEFTAGPRATLDTIQNTIGSCVNCCVVLWDAIVTPINAIRECISVDIMVMTVATIVIVGLFASGTPFTSGVKLIKRLAKITLFIIKILWKCIYSVFVLVRLFLFYVCRVIKWSSMIIPFLSLIAAIGSLCMWWWAYVCVSNFINLYL